MVVAGRLVLDKIYIVKKFRENLFSTLPYCGLFGGVPDWSERKLYSATNLWHPEFVMGSHVSCIINQQIYKKDGLEICIVLKRSFG